MNYHSYVSTATGILKLLINDIIVLPGMDQQNATKIMKIVGRRSVSNCDVSQLHIKGCKIPAIWDTGASMTNIREDILIDLGLKPSGKCLIFGATGEGIKNRYRVSLILEGRIFLPQVNVVALTKDEFKQNALIGMDIIRHGDFATTTINLGQPDAYTRFSFSLPAKRKFNFVEDEQKRLHAENKRKSKKRNNRKHK